MHTQTLTRKVVLDANWQDNNFEGLAKFTRDINSLNKIISNIAASKEVDVVTISLDVAITIKEAEKDGESLDTSFWINVAQGHYE